MDQDKDDVIVAFPLASPSERLLAAIIDWLIIGAFSATVFGAIFGLLYLLLKDSLPFWSGQSVGKKVMKIKVVDNDTYEPIVSRYDKSALRNITLLIPVFQFIDALMVYSSDRKRYGDYWARTVVIKEV